MKINQGMEEEYAKYVEDNSKDPYSKSVVEAGEQVGLLLDNPKNPPYKAERGLHGFGLSGFQGGSAIAAIAHFHPRGEEMQNYWNGKNGH